MAEDGGGGNRRNLLDLIVDGLSRLLDLVGLNGGRLRWRWRQRKARLAEAGLRGEIAWRSTQGKHKMCPACRALVPRSSRTCPECGEPLGNVSTPGISRLVTNLFPGMTSVTSIVLLVNGFWFALVLIKQIQLGLAAGGGGLSLFGGFDTELLVRFGAGLSQPRMLAGGEVTGGEWWRIVTPIFLHGGLLHFFFNSYVLLQVGPIAEQIYGPTRFWTIYLACGLVGSAASQLTHYVITVGASGAIVGLIGLLLAFGWRHGGVMGQSIKAAMLRYVIYLVIFSLLFANGIDHRNHAGGFICGLLLGLVVPAGESRNRSATTAWQVAAFCGALLVLVAFYKVADFGMMATPHP